ncbi:MAG: pyridoxamine 5'-phosphate oxidase family protein [Actinomycetota bacterium]|nr:pyridoxamine 5'-phosphate oxidase family protein [Actinomycetota bacterium]
MDDTQTPGPPSTPSGDLQSPGPAHVAGPDELAERECWDLLRRAVVGRLAVIHGGAPDIFPVNHLVDHGSIVIRTAAGTKLATSAGRPVAFEVDGHDLAAGTAWSVVVRGTARKILEREETLSALQLPLVPWHGGRKAWFLRIEPDEVTGRLLVLSPDVRETLSHDG